LLTYYVPVSGVHCDAPAAADSTADGDLGTAKSGGTASLSTYGEFSEEDRKMIETTGTKQEFQAEVISCLILSCRCKFWRLI
jgi:hypothetical protein